jgi:ubiquinone/menaquinone biosynthesis C-methylase UbiE
MEEQEVVAAAYDAGVEDEFQRLTNIPFGEVEYELTTELLGRFIQPGSSVADIGCGPGRYAEHLLNRGCRVGAVDLSGRSLQVFLKRVPPAFSGSILFSEKGCATNLHFIEDKSFDAVLLMGPLYHLSQENDRQQAVKECLRILKPGGHIFATFVSPYPKLKPMLELRSEDLMDSSYMLQFSEPATTMTMFKGYELPEVRYWPAAAKMLMQSIGFTTVQVRNLDGICQYAKRHCEQTDVTGKSVAAVLDVMRKTCDHPDLIGMTTQYLYVGRKN